MTQRQGILIAIEGIDGAGKTTQVGMLARALAACGETVITSKEPTNGPHGRRIRESAANGRMSLDDEIQAFVEDRKEHVQAVIRPHLDVGAIVLLDRYYFSTIAYQGARGASVPDLIHHMESIAPAPDLVVILDIDPHLSLFRISNSRGDTPNEFEKAESLKQVREIFLRLADSYQASEIKTVDASRSMEAVYEQIAGHIIDGPLKRKRCAKGYDCDPMYCTWRITGVCDWFRIQQSLRAYAAV